MTQTPRDVGDRRPQLPEAMLRKLNGFRQHVRRIKMTEVGLAIAFGFLVSYLLVFGFDRLGETPVVLRVALLAAAVVATALALPRHLLRWVWNTRTLDQLSKLIARRNAALGDRVLGTVELSRDEHEWRRSPVLVEAAIAQAGTDVESRDLTELAPVSKHRGWGKALVVPTIAALVLAITLPAVSANALQRWIAPWSDTARYTFARVSALPTEVVVARGEESTLNIPLEADSRWKPERGVATIDGIEVEATLENDAYRFVLPALAATSSLEISIGDARLAADVRPVERPEIRGMVATIALPSYLGIDEPRTQDVRGGSVTVVEESEVSFQGKATRALTSASLNGVDLAVEGARFEVARWSVKEDSTHELTWVDEYGLAGSAPFGLHVRSHVDEAPGLSVNDLRRDMVLLETETLNFEVWAEDDFGVREVGLRWSGVEDTIDNPTPAVGERMIAAGQPDQTEIEAAVAFNAKRLGIPAQQLRVQAYAKDAFPGRELVLSTVYNIYVLTPEQHMIWLTGELAEWFEQAVEVRDRERELHHKNKAMREMDVAEFDDPKARRQVENQAIAERANGRRLNRLTDRGNDLLTQAARNSEFNVKTMNDWAEMVKILQDIASNRMPSVSELLAKASSAEGQSESKSMPSTGQVKDSSKGGTSPPTEQGKTAPSVADIESSFNEASDSGQKPAEDQPPTKTNSSLGLVGTVVQGGGPKQDPEDTPPSPPSPAQSNMDEAIDEQTKLLAEFDKVAGKISEILRNLEGSTFVKRLKSASRRQTKIAGTLNDSLEKSFGFDPQDIDQAVKDTLEDSANVEQASSKRLSNIQADLEAYSSRVENPSATTVIGEMKKMSVSSNLTDISRSVKANFGGDSIARTEFWADTFDRWAEQLVGPG